jgi:hypothetical protein
MLCPTLTKPVRKKQAPPAKPFIGFMPAIAKGFIDRVLLPGFAFKHHSGKIFPEKLLKGKSLRLLPDT